MIASVGLAPRAQAQPQPDAAAVRDAARELGREGVRKYEAGDWEGARQLFRQAYRLVPAPTLAVREARALVKLSRLVEAAEAYDRAAAVGVDLSSPAPFREAVTDAQLEVEALRPRIPRVLIKVEGADVADPALTVRVDGVPVPAAALGSARPVDPGTHRIEAIASGNAKPVMEMVSLRESDFRAVVLHVEPSVGRMTPLAAPQPTPVAARADADVAHPIDGWRIAGWSGVALGAAGLAVGATTGVLALQRSSDLEDACVGSRCPRSAQDDIDAFRTLRTVSTIGYVAGAVAAGAGITILLAAPDRSSRAPRAGIETFVAPGNAGVRGTF